MFCNYGMVFNAYHTAYGDSRPNQALNFSDLPLREFRVVTRFTTQYFTSQLAEGPAELLVYV